MVIGGGILLVIALVLFFIQRNAKQKVASIRRARGGSIAELQQIAAEIAAEIGAGSWRDYVKLRGDIQCNQPLISELKQVPCVYYTMTVEREYEETVTKRDDEGRTTRKTERKSEVVSRNSQSTPFLLQDGSGTILIDPTGASIETVSVLDEFRAGFPANGSISFGRFSLSLGGNGHQTLGYRYRESILPLDRSAFILGQVSDAQGSSDNNVRLTIEKSTEKGKKFMITLKSEDQLRQGADSTAKYTFYGMIATLTAGAILLVAGLLQ